MFACTASSDPRHGRLPCPFCDREGEFRITLDKILLHFFILMHILLHLCAGDSEGQQRLGLVQADRWRSASACRHPGPVCPRTFRSVCVCVCTENMSDNIFWQWLSCNRRDKLTADCTNVYSCVCVHVKVLHFHFGQYRDEKKKINWLQAAAIMGMLPSFPSTEFPHFSIFKKCSRYR